MKRAIPLAEDCPAGFFKRRLNPEDAEVAKQAYDQLKAAGGDRGRAGWLKWDEVKEDLS